MKKISKGYSGQSVRAKSWKRVGKAEIIFDKYGKKLVRQDYLNPITKKTEDFYFLDWPDTVDILPITSQGEAVIIKEFFHGPEKIIRTLPGGCLNPGEKAREGVERELLEETGYKCARIIGLPPSMFLTIRNSHSKADFFLGLGAKKVSKQKLDENESIEVEVLPLKKWLELCDKETVSPGDIVATFRALPHLKQNGFLK